jgi:hypothetical protein
MEDRATDDPIWKNQVLEIAGKGVSLKPTRHTELPW